MEATFGLTGPVAYSRGWPNLLRPANPAAGAGISHKVPGDRVQRLLVARATLKTSEAVATRVAALQLLDADGAVFAAFSPAGEVKASGEANFTWGVGLGYSSTVLADESQVSIPELLLLPGMSVRVAIAAQDAADQVSGVAFYLEEWPNGPEGYETGREPTLIPPWLTR